MTETKNPDAAVNLVPGQSIGPLRIGMARGDLSQTGFEPKPHPSGQLGDAVHMLGPYQIVLDDRDRVASIEVKLRDLPGGVLVGGHVLPSGTTLEQIVKALPSCGPVEAREGGTVVVCGGGTTLVKAGSDEPSVVEIQIVAHGFLTP